MNTCTMWHPESYGDVSVVVSTNKNLPTSSWRHCVLSFLLLLTVAVAVVVVVRVAGGVVIGGVRVTGSKKDS